MRERVIAWEGRLDAPVANRLLADLALLRGARTIVLDLSAVTYMDAACFGVLTQLIRLTWTRNGEVILRNPSPPVVEKLREGQLDQVVKTEVK